MWSKLVLGVERGGQLRLMLLCDCHHHALLKGSSLLREALQRKLKQVFWTRIKRSDLLAFNNRTTMCDDHDLV
jgi:hypothetical protein